MAEPLVAVLAAGRAERFGGGKLAASCAGKPLGRWVIEAAERAGLGQGLIVTGSEGASYAPGWTALVNPNPEVGIGSSLALAARHALDAGAGSLLVLLADMPLLDAGYLQRLAAAAAPAATRYPKGHAGVPALFDRALLEQASALTGDRGMGPLLRAATLFDAPDGMLADVDTAADLANVVRVIQQAQAHPESVEGRAKPAPSPDRSRA
ncbi:MAG: NTP transferase domain-containing protein [Croceibacterium sp.]